MPYNLLHDVSTTYFYTLYETIRAVNNAGRLWIHEKKNNMITVGLWFVSRIFYMYITCRSAFLQDIGTFCINQVLALIIDVIIAKSSSVQKYFELQSELKDYMEHKNIPVYLQKRLLQYQDFRYQRRYFREFEILSTISGQLKQVCHKGIQVLLRIFQK